MIEDMISNDLRLLLRASPFRPFRLNLADGRHIDVPHPEFVLVMHKEPSAIFEREDGTAEWINLLIVVSVETLSDSRAA